MGLPAPPVSSSSESQPELISSRTFTHDIAPHWHDRVAQLLFRRPLPKQESRALDIHCAHGHTTLKLLSGLHPDSQILALGADAGLREFTQRRLQSHKQRVHVHAGNFDEITTFPDEDFDFICANLVLGQSVPDWRQGLAEIYRVLAPGGQARASLALAGTWADATQIVLGVLKAHGATWAHDQLVAIESSWPAPRDVLTQLRALVSDPADIDLEVERFELLFSNARDFFHAPLVEQGPLALWRALVRHRPDCQALLWRMREAFAAYYDGHVIALPVVAGVATVRRTGSGTQTATSLVEQSLAPYPELLALHRAHHPNRVTGESPIAPAQTPHANDDDTQTPSPESAPAAGGPPETSGEAGSAREPNSAASKTAYPPPPLRSTKRKLDPPPRSKKGA